MPSPDESPTALAAGSETVAAASSGGNRHLQAGVVVALVLGYALLSHYGSSSTDAKGLGAALSVGPVFLLVVILLWRWTRPLIALLGTALMAALLYRYWEFLEQHFEWSDLVQQCAVFTLISWSFARSLFDGRVPLCTKLALELHGTSTAAEAAYTRKATLAWAGFYLLVAVSILIVFFAAPLRIWSLFVNFGTFALIAVMGLADLALRRWVLPRRPGGSMVATLQRLLLG